MRHTERTYFLLEVFATSLADSELPGGLGEVCGSSRPQRLLLIGQYQEGRRSGISKGAPGDFLSC